MIIVFFTAVFGITHYIKLANTDNYLLQSNGLKLTERSSATKFRILNEDTPLLHKKIRSEISNEVIGTERGTLILNFYYNDEAREKLFELRVKDYDSQVYMLAQSEHCAEYCDECAYFKMNKCDAKNEKMLFMIEDTDVKTEKLPRFEDFPRCKPCEESAISSRCIPCENPPSSTCFSNSPPFSPPPCPCSFASPYGPPYY